MDKNAAALVLDEISTMLELVGENPFRARAFYAAARALDGVRGDLDELVASGALAEVRGFGPATVAVVRDLVETGASRMHQELRERTPPGLFDLLRLPGLGPKRIFTLHKELSIASLEELERAAVEDRIAALPGFGAKTQARLVEGLAFVRSQRGRRRQPEAWAVARWLAAFLAGHPAVARVEVAGELRRSLEIVDGIDLVAAVVDVAGPVLDAFATLPGVTGGGRVGELAASIKLADAVQARLTCVAPDAFVAALLHATGSPAHVAALADRAASRGLRLNEFGLWRGESRVPLPDEASLYAALGLGYIEPELREAGDEVAAAAAGTLPRLVRLEDLRGCFHCHTTYSDGKASLMEMAEAARARGWRYLGIADHSQAAAYAGGLTPARIDEQHREIDAWNAVHGHELWLFKGIEADILPDGQLDYADYGDAVLGRFDYVVGSVHSSFGLSEAEMTARVLRAIENPHLTMLGHATGRLLLGREGYKLDLDAVIRAAAARDIVIEINANPRRLELDWRHWRRARELGVRTAVNPDAHAVTGLDDVAYGLGVARKGWLTAENVVNTWELGAVRELFGR